MIEIKSKNNQVLKEVRLLSKKKERVNKALFKVEGIKMVEEAILGGEDIRTILVSEDFDFSQVAKYNIEKNVYLVASKLFNEISDTESPQGIMAIVGIKTYAREEIDVDGRYIFLDGLQDPGNLGTIIRSAEAFNMSGVILGEGTVDAYNEKVVRSTMGSIFRVPLHNMDYEDLLGLKARGMRVVSTSLEGKTDLKPILQKGIIITIGNESKGISSQLEEISDDFIKIPMHGKVESLNAAIAGSIIMYGSTLNTDIS